MHLWIFGVSLILHVGLGEAEVKDNPMVFTTILQNAK